LNGNPRRTGEFQDKLKTSKEIANEIVERQSRTRAHREEKRVAVFGEQPGGTSKEESYIF
jgi:hypothetical protein